MFGLLSILLSLFSAISTPQAHAASDALAQQRITFVAADPDAVLATTAANSRDIFDRYEMGLDSGMTIVRAKTVTGPKDSPRVQASVKKCVAFICQTVDFDTDITIVPTKANCDANYVMTADLARSGRQLTDVYSSFEVLICMKKTGTGATLDLNASAVRASSYSGGIVQQEILKVLRLQIAPITRAINATLKQNGATRARGVRTVSRS